MANIIKSEKDWQAEDDARIMAQYEEIMTDSQRKSRAVKAAKSMASDLNKRASAMNKVASTKSSKSTSKSKSNKKK